MRFTKFAGTLHPADPEAVSWWMQLPEGAEIQVKAVPNQRTVRQNAALHCWLRDLAKSLNEAGFDMLTFPWKEGVEIPWSLDLAKERLWMPVQEVVTGKRHTSDLTTKEVNDVYEPLARRIAQTGVQVPPMGVE